MDKTMNLRDIYACFALAGYLANPSHASQVRGNVQGETDMAYRYADAMLKSRKEDFEQQGLRSG